MRLANILFIICIMAPGIVNAQTDSSADEGLTSMLLKAGYSTETTNYGGDAQGQFTEFFVSQKGAYDFRFGQHYLNKLNDNAMSFAVGACLYFPGNYKLDADIGVAPGARLFPRQSYGGAISQGTDIFRTTLAYAFKNYQTANFHEGRLDVRVGAGKFFGVTGTYTLERELASANVTHHDFGGIIDARPVRFLGLVGFFSRLEKDYEPERFPEFFPFSANRYGGGIRIFALGDQGLLLDYAQEDRSNGESVRTFTVATQLGF